MVVRAGRWDRGPAGRRVFFFLIFFIYDSHRDRERGRDIGRGRSRLHAPGARRGIRFRVSRIAPWAKGRRRTAAPPRDPHGGCFEPSWWPWARVCPAGGLEQPLEPSSQRRPGIGEVRSVGRRRRRDSHAQPSPRRQLVDCVPVKLYFRSKEEKQCEGHQQNGGIRCSTSV